MRRSPAALALKRLTTDRRARLRSACWAVLPHAAWDATFFLCGYRIDLYPELAARIAAEGHETGTHGDAHSYFTSMSRAEVLAAILPRPAASSWRTWQGGAPTPPRPPGGLYDAAVLQQTACADPPVILWSVDPEDWGRARCGRRDGAYPAPCGAGLRGPRCTTRRTRARRARCVSCGGLQAQGYEFLTVSDAGRAQRGSALRPGQGYCSFPP